MKKIISRLNNSGGNITVEVEYITCQGLSEARWKDGLSMRSQQMFFFSKGCNKSLE